MEPGENEDEKWGDDVEMHDHLDTPVESDDGDGMANGDDGESGNGDDAAKNNGQSDDDNTLVERAEPEEKKKRGKMAKTDEEKDATSARGQAATEAVSHLYGCSQRWYICHIFSLTNSTASK